ncbi:hypothetical protein Tco_1134178 [Tanacetum coccineum]
MVVNENVAAASALSKCAARCPTERIGLGRWLAYTGEGGDSGKGIWGGDEDHGDSGDAGGEDIASNLATSESDHAGTGNGSGMVILAVMRYAG